MQGNSQELLPKTSGFQWLGETGHQVERAVSAPGRTSGSSCSNCPSNPPTNAEEPSGMSSLPL